MKQKISDDRFAKMSQRYEAEQGENAKKIKALRLELRKSEGRQMDVDTFLETVRRYTNATEITRRMVAELIDHIDVYHAEKKDGVARAFHQEERRNADERRRSEAEAWSKILCKRYSTKQGMGL